MFRYLSASLIFLMPFLSVAQSEDILENASIIANSIEIDAEGNLTAKGNVEIHYKENILKANDCLLYTSPSPRDKRQSRMPSSA